MEQEAPSPHKPVADKADEKYCIVAILSAGLDAKVGQINEKQVRQCIYDLGRVRSSIIILQVYC